MKRDAHPLVSLCIVTYNRLAGLIACLDSFFATVDYDSIEIVIVDNASTDERVTKHIASYRSPRSSAVVKIRRESNDYPIGPKLAKTMARQAATGDVLIDCPDDHLFVTKSDWLTRSIDLLMTLRDASCVVYYAYPAYRFAKQNNAMSRSVIDGKLFRSETKGYADYSVMLKSTYDSIGPFKHELGAMCESDYMERCASRGLRRYMLSVPVAVINDSCDLKLVCPIEEHVLPIAWQSLVRPVTNEELLRFAITDGYVSACENVARSYDDIDDHELSSWLGG